MPIHFFYLLVFTSYLITSCSDKSQRISPQVTERFYVNGDPLTLLEGSTPNPSSFLTVDNLRDFDDFNFSIAIYQERSERTEPAPTDKITDGQEPDRERSFQLRRLQFKKGGENTFFYRDRMNDRDVLAFQKSPDNRLHLSHYYGVPVSRVIHYSLKDSREAFSILFSVQTVDLGTMLIAFYATKNHVHSKSLELSDSHESAPVLDQVLLNYPLSRKDYYFFQGYQTKMRWKDSIELTYCSLDRGRGLEATQRAVQAWAPDGKIGQVNLNLNAPDRYPPFSDMNTHCIAFANVYRTGSNDRFISMGEAYPIFNYTNQHIETSSVFIYEQRIDKIVASRKQELKIDLYYHTVAHEIGHFIGLPHFFIDFAKKNNQRLRDSVMDYRTDIPDVTSSDLEWAAELYSDAKSKF